jgi:hypothetical protein
MKAMDVGYEPGNKSHDERLMVFKMAECPNGRVLITLRID